MAIADVIAHIDAEIAKLQQVKSMLSSGGPVPAVKSGRGRPKGSKNAPKPAEETTATKTPKRKLSPEGRRAISEAMKRRHAERRKETA